MTTYRLPQPGEVWRVRPRPSPEWTCPGCGQMWGQGYAPMTVTVRQYPNAMKWLRHVLCGARVPMPAGMVGVDELSPLGKQLSIPLAWLSPLEAEGSPR